MDVDIDLAVEVALLAPEDRAELNWLIACVAIFVSIEISLLADDVILETPRCTELAAEFIPLVSAFENCAPAFAAEESSCATSAAAPALIEANAAMILLVSITGIEKLANAPLIIAMLVGI